LQGKAASFRFQVEEERRGKELLVLHLLPLRLARGKKRGDGWGNKKKGKRKRAAVFSPYYLSLRRKGEGGAQKEGGEGEEESATHSALVRGRGRRRIMRGKEKRGERSTLARSFVSGERKGGEKEKNAGRGNLSFFA